MVAGPLDTYVERIREFNRFYTGQIGVLQDGYLESPFSLTEARVLYELAHHERLTARDLADEMSLDTGYVSRLLQRFERKGLIERQVSPDDGRRKLVRLTDEGRAAFAPLEDRSREDIGRMLSALPAAGLETLVAAMTTIEQTLAGATTPSYLLRPHRPGDMGWVIGRHGALYATEYGWDATFEALVARIAADFIDHFDPVRERCWIAERNGVTVGSIFLVKHPERPGVAKLRMLIVEPGARGMGIGQRLVEECLLFAKHCGYQTVTLWTVDILTAARKLYVQAGFRLVDEQPVHQFGVDLVDQTWELAL